ncbi:MAG: NOP5/NOP56 family protein [Candidatus Diapherotrites archaeon]
MQKSEELRKRLIAKAKKRVAEAFTGRDYHAIKAVNLLEDLDNAFNLFAEQAREWFGVHFPELNRMVQDNEAFLKLIALGERKNFTQKKVMELYKNEIKAKEIEAKARNSMGAELEKEDLRQIQLLAQNALELKKEREEIAKYIEKLMKELSPNFSGLATPIIAARLLAKAGSLKQLALMPSSTIQLLGAEKALFRHLKQKAKPPKYGLIFAHPSVREAKKELKGKIARKLSGKLSIAAKKDFFSKKA